LCVCVMAFGLPTSAPFPYPTLFRSLRAGRPAAPVVDLALAGRLAQAHVLVHVDDGVDAAGLGGRVWPGAVEGPAGVEADLAQVRSEEHTSELQSRENLVCRLLLEKK